MGEVGAQFLVILFLQLVFQPCRMNPFKYDRDRQFKWTLSAICGVIITALFASLKLKNG